MSLSTVFLVPNIDRGECLIYPAISHIWTTESRYNYALTSTMEVADDAYIVTSSYLSLSLPPPHPFPQIFSFKEEAQEIENCRRWNSLVKTAKTTNAIVGKIVQYFHQENQRLWRLLHIKMESLTRNCKVNLCRHISNLSQKGRVHYHDSRNCFQSCDTSWMSWRTDSVVQTSCNNERDHGGSHRVLC